MRSSSIAAIVGISLCGLLAGAQKCAEPTKAEELDKEPGFPKTCPYWEVMDLGGGDFYYLCDYYPTECADTPEATYHISGQLPLYEHCPHNCVEAHKVDGDAEPQGKDDDRPPRFPGPAFEGLDEQVEPDYEFEFPAGDPRRYGNVVDMEQLIKFGDGTRLVYAKVFRLVLDRGQRNKKDPLTDIVVSYLAIHVDAAELSDEAKENAENYARRVTRLESMSDPCYSFAARFRGQPMLVLTARRP